MASLILQEVHHSDPIPWIRINSARTEVQYMCTRHNTGVGVNYFSYLKPKVSVFPRERLHTLRMLLFSFTCSVWRSVHGHCMRVSSSAAVREWMCMDWLLLTQLRRTQRGLLSCVIHKNTQTCTCARTQAGSFTPGERASRLFCVKGWDHCGADYGGWSKGFHSVHLDRKISVSVSCLSLHFSEFCEFAVNVWDKGARQVPLTSSPLVMWGEGPPQFYLWQLESFPLPSGVVGLHSQHLAHLQAC